MSKKLKPRRKKRPVIVTDMIAAREEAARRVANSVVEGVVESVDFLRKNVKNVGLDTLPQGCGTGNANRVNSAKLLLSLVSMMPTGQKSVEVKSSEDGKTEIQVRFTDQPPPGCGEDDA